MTETEVLFVSLSAKTSMAENLKPGHNGHGCNPSK